MAHRNLFHTGWRLRVEDIRHCIQTRRLSDDPRRRMEGTGGEGGSGVGGVGDGDGFAGSAEVDFVVADHVAHAQCVDPDLAPRTRTGFAVSSVYDKKPTLSQGWAWWGGGGRLRIVFTPVGNRRHTTPVGNRCLGALLVVAQLPTIRPSSGVLSG